MVFESNIPKFLADYINDFYNPDFLGIGRHYHKISDRIKVIKGITSFTLLKWFTELLKKDVRVRYNRIATFVSDNQKNLPQRFLQKLFHSK